MQPTISRAERRRPHATIQERALLLAAEGANDRLRFLLDASRLLTGSLDLQRTLDELCRLVAPRFADWCVVDLLDEKGRLNLAASADVEPSKASLLKRLRRLYPPEPERHPAYRAVKTGRPQAFTRVDDSFLAASASTRHHLRLLRSLGLGSFVTVPLGEPARCLGALTIGFAAGGRLLGEEEIRVAEELGLRAGSALSNAMLYKQAQESQAKLSRALGAARMVAWDWNLKTGEVVRSGPALELFGLPERGYAASDVNRVHPDDRPARAKAIRRALAKGGRWVLRYRLLRPSSVQWVEEHGGAEGGCASGVLLDVTAAQEAEESLRRQREEQELILDAVDAMIWYKDAENRIVRCNEAAARWAGLRRGDVEGRSAYELFPREQAQAFHEDDLEVLRDGRPRRGVIAETTSLDGEKRWVRRDKFPFKDGLGRPGIIIFAVDITEQKKAEDALRNSERVQREFVANVSHEFRTPVAAIKGFAETLRRGGLSDSRNRGRFVRVIEAHAERLGWLVEDVLTLSSLESGEGPKLAPVDLTTLLRDYAGSIAPVTRAKRVTIEVRVPNGLYVLADQPYLLQVIENLVGNAIKFNKPGGKVWLSAREKGAEVLLSVRDNGQGIPPSALPRVFDRFFKAPGTGAIGTGLGLNIAKRIVERHGGRIWAESAPGRGACFHVALPRPNRGA